MVEGTALQVMVLGVLLTLVYFESEEVEEHYGLTHADLARVKAATVNTGPLCCLMVVVALVMVPAGVLLLLLLLRKLFINRYLLLELILVVLLRARLLLLLIRRVCLLILLSSKEACLRALIGVGLARGALIQLLVLESGI